MGFTLKEAVQVVGNHKEELPFADQNQKEGYVSFLNSQLNSELERQKNDHLEAVKLAVDVSKTLVAIATGFFVAVGAFIQYGLQQGLAACSWTSIALYAAGVFLFVSMALGVKVTGDAYNRGAGIIQSQDPPWRVQPLRPLLRWQIGTGIIASVAFVFAVFLWPSQEENTTGAQWRLECKEEDSTREQDSEQQGVYICG